MTSPMPHAQSQSEAERKQHNREHPTAHKTELAGQLTAGGIGSAFGAAKLRDQHREQYPVRHTAGVKHAVKVVRAHGANPQQAAKIAHVLHGDTGMGGKVARPGFKSGVALATAGAVATAAHRSTQLSDAIARRKDKISMSADPVEGDGILEKSEPRRAHSAPVRLRVTPPPKHAAKPYVGKRRVLTRVDKIKALGVQHSPRLFDAAEAATDLFKGANMTTSAFGVEHTDYLSKAVTGEKGDKRNTKYAAAGYGGAVAGGAVGRQVATRTAGTSPGDVGRLARASTPEHAEAMLSHVQRANPGNVKEAFQAGRGAAKAGMKSITEKVPGAARMVRGGKVGALAGVPAGAAAYAAHRHHKSKISMSADSGCAFVDERLAKADDDDAPKPKPKPNAKPSAGRMAAGTAFGSLHSAVAGKKGRKLGAVGSSLGHAYGGATLGGAAAALATKGKSPAAIGLGTSAGAYGGSARAVVTNSRKGRYKRES